MNLQKRWCSVRCELHPGGEGEIGGEEASGEHDKLGADEEIAAVARAVLHVDGGEWRDLWRLSSALGLAVAGELLLVEDFHLSRSGLPLVFGPRELILIVLQAEHWGNLTVDLGEQRDGVDLRLAVEGEDGDVADLVGNDEIIWKADLCKFRAENSIQRFSPSVVYEFDLTVQHDESATKASRTITLEYMFMLDSPIFDCFAGADDELCGRQLANLRTLDRLPSTSRGWCSVRHISIPKKHCDVIKSFIDDGLRPFQMPAHRYFISKIKEILSKYRKTCLKLFVQSWKLNWWLCGFVVNAEEWNADRHRLVLAGLVDVVYRLVRYWCDWLLSVRRLAAFGHDALLSRRRR